jgi:pyruvate dehydrogenase (quinone)
VDRPENIAGAWDEAIGAERPAVVEMMVDPEVPPLPPHIELKKARIYLQALMKDPAGGEALRATIKQWWA